MTNVSASSSVTIRGETSMRGAGYTGCFPGARSSGDRARASGARGRRFESCRAHRMTRPRPRRSCRSARTACVEARTQRLQLASKSVLAMPPAPSMPDRSWRTPRSHLSVRRALPRVGPRTRAQSLVAERSARDRRCVSTRTDGTLASSTGGCRRLVALRSSRLLEQQASEPPLPEQVGGPASLSAVVRRRRRGAAARAPRASSVRASCGRPLAAARGLASTDEAHALANLAIVRRYLSVLDPRLPRDVYVLQSAGCSNAFGNGVVLPFLHHLPPQRARDLARRRRARGGDAVGRGARSGFLAGTFSDRHRPEARAARRARVDDGRVRADAVHPRRRGKRSPSTSSGLGSGSFWPSQSTLLAGLDAARATRRRPTRCSGSTMNVGVALGGVAARARSRRSRTAVVQRPVPDRLRHVPRLHGRARRASARRSCIPSASGGTLARRLRDRVVHRVHVPERRVHRRGDLADGRAAAGVREERDPRQRARGRDRLRARLDRHRVFQLPVAKLARGPAADARARADGRSSGPRRCSLVLGARASGRDDHRGARVLAGAMLVFALGECLHGAIHVPLGADLAPPQLVGRYLALSSLSWQVGWIVGPAGAASSSSTRRSRSGRSPRR